MGFKLTYSTLPPHSRVIGCLAKERVLKLYNQGMDLEEVAVRVKEELGLTDVMIVKALDLAREDVGLKSSEVEGLEELRREGEEASRRVLELPGIG